LVSRIPVFIVHIFLLFNCLLYAEDKVRLLQKIETEGFSGVVKIGNLLPEPEQKLSESDLRSISASITREYHLQGYNAFYLRRIVFSESGVLRLECWEGRVSKIILQGFSTEEKELFHKGVIRAGDIYNDVVYKTSLLQYKNLTSMESVNTDMGRFDDGTLYLKVKPKRHRQSIHVKALREPLFNESLSLGYLYSSGNFKSAFRGSSTLRESGESRRSLLGLLSYGEKISMGLSGLYGEIDDQEETMVEFCTFSGRLSSTFFDKRLIALFEAGVRNYLSEEEMDYGMECISILSLAYDNSGFILESNGKTGISGELLAGYSKDRKGYFYEGTLAFLFSIDIAHDFLSMVIQGDYDVVTFEESPFAGYLYDKKFPVDDSYVRFRDRGLGSLFLKFNLGNSGAGAGPVFYYGTYYCDEDRYSQLYGAGIRLDIELSNFKFLVEQSFGGTSFDRWGYTSVFIESLF